MLISTEAIGFGNGSGVGLLVVPRLLNFVARFGQRRLLVAVLGLCFGTSLVAA